MPIFCTQLQWGKEDGEWLSEDIFSLDGVEEITESRCNTRKVSANIINGSWMKVKVVKC